MYLSFDLESEEGLWIFGMFLRILQSTVPTWDGDLYFIPVTSVEGLTSLNIVSSIGMSTRFFYKSCPKMLGDVLSLLLALIVIFISQMIWDIEFF